MPAPPETSRTGQRAFAAALLDPDAPPPSDLAAVGGVSPEKRFAVYRNNVVVSLVSALASAYPTVRKLVGEPFFDAMAGVYVRAHPPTSPLMIHYGAEFPGWVEGFEPAQSVPYLPDMARLERARRRAYHAADAAPLGAEAFQAIAPEALDGVRVDLHPSVSIVRSERPVFSIWRNVNGDETPVPQSGEDVLIARPGDDVEMRALPPGAAAFLTALSEGAPLGAAAGAGAQDDPSFDLALTIGGMIESRVIARLTAGGAE